MIQKRLAALRDTINTKAPVHIHGTVFVLDVSDELLELIDIVADLAARTSLVGGAK